MRRISRGDFRGAKAMSCGTRRHCLARVTVQGRALAVSMADFRVSCNMKSSCPGCYPPMSAIAEVTADLPAHENAANAPRQHRQARGSHSALPAGLVGARPWPGGSNEIWRLDGVGTVRSHSHATTDLAMIATASTINVYFDSGARNSHAAPDLKGSATSGIAGLTRGVVAFRAVPC